MLRCLLCGAMCSGRPLISMLLISVEHHKPFKERITNTHKLAIISLDFQHLSLFATVSGEVKRKGQREGEERANRQRPIQSEPLKQPGFVLNCGAGVLNGQPVHLF